MVYIYMFVVFFQVIILHIPKTIVATVSFFFVFTTFSHFLPDFCRCYGTKASIEDPSSAPYPLRPLKHGPKASLVPDRCEWG